MKPSRRTASALLFLLLSAGLPDSVRAQYDVIETRDLRLVYPRRSLGYLAPYVARCFENSMAFHRQLWEYTPSEKVTLSLDDVSDYSNAGVWVSPVNSMYLHVAPANFVYETSPSNERMNFLMNHEVVHVVASDKAAGSDLLFRKLLLGKVLESTDDPVTMLYNYFTVPRRAAPRWYQEGIAVFLETWMAGGYGRAQGPYDEMVFRSMVLDSSRFYDPLGLESEGTKVDFQVGVNSYLYGTRFMSYLAYTYSPDHLIRWVGRAPGSKAYFASQFEHVFGKSLTEGWRDWVAFERGFQRANLDSVRRFPTTPYRDLARTGLGSVSRAFVSRDGRSLYVGVYYPGAVAHIASVSLEDGSMRMLQEVKGPTLYFVTSLAYDAVADTLYYTTDNNRWRDLCALDPNTGRSRILFRDSRLGDLAFNPADRSLWGVRHSNGISSVWRIPPPYDVGYQVWTLQYGLDLYDLDISPDGKHLAASMAEVSGRQTLRLMAIDSLLAGNYASQVLHDFGTAVPTSFVWSPDGGHLYGSSYYTGVSNIFRYDVAADSMDIVSNCETGFFRPVPTTGDSLIVFRYSGDGFVPARIAPRPLTDVSAVTYFGNQVVERFQELKTWVRPPPSQVNLDSLQIHTGPYQGLRGIRLTNAYPVLQAYKDRTATGVRLNFGDPLQLYDLYLTGTVTPQGGLPDDERIHVSVGYQQYQWEAKFRYNGASFYDLVGPVKTSRKGHGGSLAHTRLLLDDNPRTVKLRLSASVYTGLERLPDNQNVATSAGFDKLASGSATLTYQFLRGTLGAPEKEKGVLASLEAEGQRVRFVNASGSAWRAFPKVAGTFDAGTTLPIRHCSLWLRTAAGRGFGDREQPFANYYFGHFGNNWVDYQESRRYRDYESFPGAPIDGLSGQSFGRSMVELLLPPLRFRRAGNLALYAAWLQVSAFGTGLITDIDRPASRQRYGNLGAQADVRLQLLTLQPLTLSVGYAQAWNRRQFMGREWMVSLKLM